MPVGTETAQKAGGQGQVNTEVTTGWAVQVCRSHNELCDTCHIQHFTHTFTHCWQIQSVNVPPADEKR